MNRLEVAQREIHRVRMAWDAAKQPYVKALVDIVSFSPARVTLDADGRVTMEPVFAPALSETQRLLHQGIEDIDRRCLAQCREVAERYGEALV